jgi:single-strand DNA-binding protein
MNSTNHFFIRGHVGRNPAAFKKACKLSVGTNRKYRNANGDRVESTNWVSLSVLTEKTAKWIVANVRQGDYVYAEGYIAEGSYEKDGETVFTTELIVTTFDWMSGKPDTGASGEDQDAA